MQYHHHYHVRLYCSLEDRMHGCLERGDIHPWIDHGDEVFQARVRKLSSLLTMKSAKWRRAEWRHIQKLTGVLGPAPFSRSDMRERAGDANRQARFDRRQEVGWAF